MTSSNNHWDRGPGPIPTRWLNCPRKSATLVGPKFLAFKTPLGHKFDDQVPPQNRFTPAMLFSSMKSYNVKIGLWIDLTNTSRFYDKSEVENEGAKYVKLHCRGHGESPSEEQTHAFVEMCHMFISKNPLDIIAVHCTHGFNRTGFLIASYYILKEDWSCDLAFTTFAKARPPGIIKKDYILDLYSRYDEPDAAPPPPELPEWHYEENADDSLDDDGGDLIESTSQNSKGGRRRVIKNKKNPVFMEGVPKVTPVTEEPKLSGIQRKIQDMCNWKQQGFPGCQPVSMTRENIQFLAMKPYKVSWKADGTRYMMFIDLKSDVYFADRDFSIFAAPDIDFREKHDLKRRLCDTLLDGEMVIDIDPKTNTKFPRYLIYDAIRIHGKDISQDNFHRRFERIYTDIISPRNAAIEKGLINKLKEPFSVRRKDFWEANVQTTTKLMSVNFRQQLWHEPDGLIFQPEPEGYVTGKCDSVLKWKPPSHNSVDFKVKVVTTREEGCLPATIGELYVGGCDVPFAKMKATKAVKELNGKIIECKLENGKWVMMRERTDKSFPNSYTTAKSVCSSIMNPVTEDMLLNFLESRGYRKPDQELMPPPRKAPRM